MTTRTELITLLRILGPTANYDAHNSMDAAADMLEADGKLREAARLVLNEDSMRRIVSMVPIYSDDTDYAHYIRIGRAVEAAHGIKEQP